MLQASIYFYYTSILPLNVCKRNDKNSNEECIATRMIRCTSNSNYSPVIINNISFDALPLSNEIPVCQPFSISYPRELKRDKNCNEMYLIRVKIGRHSCTLYRANVHLGRPFLLFAVFLIL